MPNRPSRAPRLMKQGRAEMLWVKGVFRIQTTYVSADDPDTVVDGVDLNTDAGASATGIVITSDTPEGRRVHASSDSGTGAGGRRIRWSAGRAFASINAHVSGIAIRASITGQGPDGWLAAGLASKQACQHSDVGEQPQRSLSNRLSLPQRQYRQ